MIPSPKLIIATAIELHKTYRAANKALYPGGPCAGGAHDHGWVACRRKAYFLKRAVRFWQDLSERMFPTVPF